MTFAEFQATGRVVEDLAAVPTLHVQEVETGPGRIYLDGDLYIAGAAPTYCLTIGNSSRCSSDLEALERELFEFAVSEGYAEESRS